MAKNKPHNYLADILERISFVMHFNFTYLLKSTFSENNPVS